MKYSTMDIKSQINSMLYLNILSYSVLSGCGNCSTPRMRDMDELEPLLESVSTDKRPYNIFFTDSLYKKCMPQYEQDTENPYDFSSFKWVNKKRKKLIDIDVMANSIIACCKLIERILTFDLQPENPNLMIYLLQKTAIHQVKFITKYLKVGGMFYNGEDVAAQDSEELHIQIASDSPDKVSQFAVFHAFSALLELSSYNLYYLDCNEEGLMEELNAFPDVLGSYTENLQECESKELSLIGLHLSEIYKENGYYSDHCRKALSKIAKELCQRIDSDGLLKRNSSSEDAASPNTASNCLNLLSQYAYMFASKSCHEASQKLYNQLAGNWDGESNIFKLSSSNKQSFNIKVATSILAALFSYTKIVHDQQAKESLQNLTASFYHTAFGYSGLFNGQCIPILQQDKIAHLEVIKYSKPWAPVFNKAFDYKLSKKKYYCEADVFRADYVLPASVILLNSISN